ncbi:MAG: ribulokinase, partial [Spirochaetaceae bacterium]|nr:ribulokinase [Spirochaetaceae bacterium]
MDAKSIDSLVLGIDYGTDSCRAIIADGRTGSELASAVSLYPRWKEGRYCDPANNVFRQSPLDYIESLIAVMDALCAELGEETLSLIRGIAIDTTGSTPCAVDEHNVPLSLKPEFADDSDAMFILWKDHSSIEEAARINATAREWGGTDYTQYEGGIYSSEWFWAKIMHVFSVNPKVRQAAYSFVEHCDWMPSLLCGTGRVQDIRRSRCAMGHKAMWHASFGGYPSRDFLAELDPDLPRIAGTLGDTT